jgi:hypothetical protein
VKTHRGFAPAGGLDGWQVAGLQIGTRGPGRQVAGEPD